MDIPFVAPARTIWGAIKVVGAYTPESAEVIQVRPGYRTELREVGMTTQVQRPVVGVSQILGVTLSLDTNAYADGELLADTQEIANAVRTSNGTGIIQSVTLLDKSDQGVALDLYFTNVATTWGTEGAALAVSDALAASIMGVVEIAATDYNDLIGSQIVTKSNLGIVVESVADLKSIYIAAASRGIATYAAAGITLKIGILWD